jgi:hypothetical protein
MVDHLKSTNFLAKFNPAPPSLRSSLKARTGNNPIVAVAAQGQGGVQLVPGIYRCPGEFSGRFVVFWLDYVILCPDVSGLILHLFAKI